MGTLEKMEQALVMECTLFFTLKNKFGRAVRNVKHIPSISLTLA